MGSGDPARASFVGYICNDAACAGGDDFFVADNAAGDTNSLVGAINFSQSAFGYTVIVNQSFGKPLIGSANQPQLDIQFSAVGSGNIWLYATDTGFLPPGGGFNLSIGGTQSAGGSVTAQAFGTNSNSELDLTNLLGTIGPLAGSPFGGSAVGSYDPAANPYSLTIGLNISRENSGITTGDLNFTAVPGPIVGAGLPGLIAACGGLLALARRRRRETV